MESKAEDGDPVPIFSILPPGRIEWVSVPLQPAVNVHFETKILTPIQRQMTLVRIRVKIYALQTLISIRNESDHFVNYKSIEQC